MKLTAIEKTENAVMWYLYTHKGAAPLGEVMKLDMYTPYLSKAVFNLRQTRKVVLESQPLMLRMVNNG